ncbi:hypothetical protein OF83DRAFT_1030784, partial [Amylostereum chailletii]
SASFSAVSFPRRIPAQECRVVPPILRDAIPVDAVIANHFFCSGPNNLMISRRRTDLPVPS